MDYKVVLPSAIQKYEKVKNKRDFLVLLTLQCKGLASILGLWVNVRGLLFYFTDANV